MIETVGIRFKEGGKIYDFDADGKQFNKGDYAIVETVRGMECGLVAKANHGTNEDDITKPLKKVIRAATEEDIKTLAENKEKEKEAFKTCEKKIEAHGLDMNLVDVEYTFDRSKLLFYFTADGRVDFRELVKDLASAFRTRIELRQIGVRDESRMVGGFGICGRPFCCNTFLNDFQPVSIKMAKEQGLSLNPTKISGTCGRLMCCLKYEQDTYEHLLRVTPKVGAIVETRDGKGRVVENNLITGMLKVALDRRPDAAPAVFHRHDVKILKDAYIKVEKEELEALKGIE
ncbi:MAG: stage 0 sporulation family protein [Clostridia bacterium]|nr:stage 0 sporulation family protein [Clostridia bacterium]MBR5544054.1 stage 0 sporulation family protein [Clostridia bacterium]